MNDLQAEIGLNDLQASLISSDRLNAATENVNVTINNYGTGADSQSIQELRAILETMDAKILSLQTQVAKNPAEISQRIIPTDGQTLFNVDFAINLTSATEVFVNGVKYYPYLDYTFDQDKKTITWLNRQFSMSSLYVLEIFG